MISRAESDITCHTASCWALMAGWALMLVHENLLFLSLEPFAPLPTQDFVVNKQQIALNRHFSMLMMT